LTLSDPIAQVAHHLGEHPETLRRHVHWAEADVDLHHATGRNLSLSRERSCGSRMSLPARPRVIATFASGHDPQGLKGAQSRADRTRARRGQHQRRYRAAHNLADQVAADLHAIDLGQVRLDVARREPAALQREISL
jgi:hypothetical protein